MPNLNVILIGVIILNLILGCKQSTNTIVLLDETFEINKGILETKTINGHEYSFDTIEFANKKDVFVHGFAKTKVTDSIKMYALSKIQFTNQENFISINIILNTNKNAVLKLDTISKKVDEIRSYSEKGKIYKIAKVSNFKKNDSIASHSYYCNIFGLIMNINSYSKTELVSFKNKQLNKSMQNVIRKIKRDTSFFKFTKPSSNHHK